MIAQNLEDLFHTAVFSKGDVRRTQDVMLEIEAELRACGKGIVITRIFSDNTSRVGVTVALHADPNSGKEVKEVTIEHKSFRSVYTIEVVYYNPAEVVQFGNVENEI